MSLKRRHRMSGKPLIVILMATILLTALVLGTACNKGTPPKLPRLPTVALPSITIPTPFSVAKCDAQLREQLLTVHGATSNASAANAIITVIHAKHHDTCPPGAWNPVVDDVDNDHQGNVDSKFWTIAGPARSPGRPRQRDQGREPQHQDFPHHRATERLRHRGHHNR